MEQMCDYPGCVNQAEVSGGGFLTKKYYCHQHFKTQRIMFWVFMALLWGLVIGLLVWIF